MENTLFVLSWFSKVKVILRSHVNSGIQNSEHFDVFYLYCTTQKKSNAVYCDNLERKGLWKTVVTNSLEEE